jgi:Putative Ig domain
MDRLLLAYIAVAAACVSIGAEATTLHVITANCPAGTQGKAYAGCTIAATGGTAPYRFSIDGTNNYAPLPEGLALNATTGKISSAQIGGQGTYQPLIIVTDHTGAKASRQITFAITGANKFLATIFPSNSIFHHRVDAATTGLPVDTSPAAPIYSGYLTATVKPFFGNAAYLSFPNGIPAFSVPYNQPDVKVSTTLYQHYFTSAPIPANAPIEGTSHSDGDRHVPIYRAAGGGRPPALYEMWQAIYLGGPWTDSSNALWPNVNTNALTPQTDGTSDAAGLPVAPLLANADEVIGAGTPAAPKGIIRHPIRFTLNHMLNYWVWPSTQTAGVGSCTTKNGTIPTESEISQAKPPVSCSMTGPAGEIYRLKASVKTPACAAKSPQAAIIITAFRHYGIILADNGDSGGLIGTPDARWNDDDLSCITSLILKDFEPVNVSSLIVSNGSGETKK